MSIYDRKVRGQPENPVKALYRYWHSVLMPLAEQGSNPVLSNWPYAMTLFGRSAGYGIGIVQPDAQTFNRQPDLDEIELGTREKPTLALGYASWALYPKFKIKANGEFQLLHAHGDQQRHLVTSMTFLDWRYDYSEIQWFVNTDERQYAPNLLTNWRTPVHYVGQKTIYRPQWGWRPPWLRLEPAGRQWKIVFSRPSESKYFRDLAVTRPELPVATAECFEKQDALRLRRYRLAKMREAVRDGTVVPRGNRLIPKEEIEQRREAQARALAAHLAVRGQTKPQLEGV